jgi:hypothetical protein
MAMNEKDKFQINIVGGERSGKSYLSKKIAEKYNKNGSVLIYNIGRMSDFPDEEFTYFEPLGFKEHIKNMHSDSEIEDYKSDPRIIYFRYNKLIYHFEDFNDLFKGKKVKMFRMTKRSEENAFFETIYKYISNCLFVLDDCKPLFVYGLKENHIQLLSRKNHTGNESKNESSRGKGVDIINIFHGIDSVPIDIWLYTTHLFLFKTSTNGTGKTLQDATLLKSIIVCQKKLLEVPQYTCYSIGFKNEGYNKVGIVTI